MKTIIHGRVARLGLVLTALAALVAGVAHAAIPAANGQISACVDRGSGQLRVIDAEAGARCEKSELPLSWSKSAPPRLWATVRRDGTLVRGQGAVSATRVAVGVYQVTFTQEPAFCGIAATLTAEAGFGPDGNSPPFQGEIVAVADGSGPPNSADVFTFDSSGARADRDVDVVVSC